MEFQGQGNADGTLKLSAFTKDEVRRYLAENGPARFTITFDLPESGKMRRFYHGAVLPLWAYLDGKDHRSAHVRHDLAELAKLEFNGAELVVNGQLKKIGRSTKGRVVLGPHVEKVITYLEENYSIDRTQCLDPDDFKHFIGAVYMHGKYDTYIDYLLELNRIPRIAQGV
jgi:hypothetical protein